MPLDTLFADVLPDVRFAARALRKVPAVTAVSIVSLAVSSGAVSAIFSLADALLLRPLPVPHARDLVALGTTTLQSRFDRVSYPDYLDYRDRLRSYTATVAYTVTPVSVSDAGSAPRITLSAVVTGNFFRALEIEPSLGRGFLDDEDRVRGRDAVVVLSDAFWRQRFSADPAVIGRVVRINAVDLTVVGVAPPSFSGLDLGVQPAVFVPMAIWPRLTRADRDPLTDRAARSLTVKGRLAPGVTRAQAAAELAALARGLEVTHPDTNRAVGATVLTELQARVEGSPAQATLVPLLVTLAITVLLVGCANVAGLQLSRGQARRKELAVRLAVGCGRARLLRQLLTESALIAAAGACFGLWLASWLNVFLRRIEVPSDLPVALQLAVDGRVLAATLAVTITSALVFGLAPALQALRVDVVPALKTDAGADQAGRRLLGRNAVVVLQVAASFIVLAIATVVYLGFRTPFTQSPGFRVEGVLTATLDPKLTGLTDARLPQWYRALADRLSETSGVESVAFTSELPMRFSQTPFSLLPEGYVPPPPAERVSVLGSIVTPGYFDTMRLPILRGRAFRDSDDAGAPQVAIVNEAFAATYFPGKDPLGRRLAFADGQSVEVIGLAKQSKYTWIAEGPTEFVYLPFAQQPQSRMVVLLGTKGDPAALAASLRAAVRAADADLPVFGVTTMADFYRRDVVGTPMTLIQTIAALGGLGLALSMVGLYGLVSYSVTLKTRELGIRLALGASRGRILGGVLGYGASLSGAGIAVGCLMALVARRALLASFPTSTDLPAYVLMPVAVMLVTLVAAWLPARRAAAVPPTVALRGE